MAFNKLEQFYLCVRDRKTDINIASKTMGHKMVKDTEMGTYIPSFQTLKHNLRNFILDIYNVILIYTVYICVCVYVCVNVTISGVYLIL